MATENAGRDQNYVTTMIGLGLSQQLPTVVYVDEATHRLLVNAVISGVDVSTLATSAKQDTGNTSLASIKTDADIIAGAVTANVLQDNLKQVGGTTVDTNSGNKSAGTQRVVIATDQPVLPISDNGGSLTIDAPLATPAFATLTPNATGGWSTFLATSSDGSTALTNAAQVIKGSAGTFGGYYIYNPNAVAIYVHIYNVAAASVTVGTTNPQNTFCIPASQAANIEFTNGINFSTAMSCAATTTGPGNTAPSTALEANFFYK